MKIFIIPATYNEKENIEKFITCLEEEVFPKIPNHEMHILVADDNSPDGTGGIVKKMMKKYKNLGINQGEKKGLGAAYLRTMSDAIDNLGADAVVSIDADFQFDPHDLPKFIEKLDKGNDLVVQTRYSDGGSIPENWPPQRKIFSIVANLFVRTVFMKFSVHDWTGGFRAMKKEVFQKISPQMHEFRGYIFQIAFLYKAVRSGFKIGEVPLHFSDRELGRSKIAPLGYILDVVKFVLWTRIYEYRRFVKFLFVGGTGFVVQYVVTYLGIRLGLEHHQYIATMIAAETAILSNFTLNNFWTFEDTKNIKQQGSFFKRLVKFNITSLASISIQGLAVYLAVLIFGETINIYGYIVHTALVILFPTIIFIVLPMNYLIYNKIIWKTQYLKKENKN